MNDLAVRKKCMEEFKKLPFQNFHEGWSIWKKAFHLGYELAKTEAIETKEVGFMEWKEDEGYECVMYDDVKMWQKKGTKPYSSEQLYNLYIKTKQQ